MRAYISVLLAAAIMIVAVPGCKRDRDTAVVRIGEGTGVGTRVDDPATEARLNRVGFLIPDFNRKVAVQSTGAKRTPTNTLEVWAVFRNRTQFNQSFQVRTQFFGPDREPNEGPHEWQNMFLPPNGIETYRTYSRGTTPEYYYIEVQPL